MISGIGEGAQNRIDHFADLEGQGLNSRDQRFVAQIEGLGNFELRLKLTVRTTLYAEGLPKFATRQAALSLCDIASNGYSSAPELRTHPI